MITVLPPMSREIKEELQRLIRQFDPQMFLACSDTAMGGVNVIRLQIHHPRNTDEIFTPLYAKGLEKAWEHQELFVVDESALAHRDVLLPSRAANRIELCDKAEEFDLTELTEPSQPLVREVDGEEAQRDQPAESVEHVCPH